MIKVKVNAEEVIRACQTYMDLTENFVPFFVEVIGKNRDNRAWTLRGAAGKAFSSKTIPFDGGGKWAKLSDSYAKQKKKKYPGMPLLVASGDLFNSLTGGTKYNVSMMSPKKLSWGTAAPYAKFLQMGTSKMPSRAFLGFNSKQTKAINTLLLRYIKAGKDGKRAALERLKAGIDVGGE